MKAFLQLSPNSKIWIYQALRDISNDEQSYIHQSLDAFVAQWNSHGSSLLGAFAILYNRFVVLAVDESKAGASGCSIDKSVAVIQQLETKFQLGLLDRSYVSYISKDETIHSIQVKEIKKAIVEGNISPDTVLFDNTITTLGQMDNQWQVEAKSSWMSRYFNIAARV